MPPRTTAQQWCDMKNKTDSSEEKILEKGNNVLNTLGYALKNRNMTNRFLTIPIHFL